LNFLASDTSTDQAIRQTTNIFQKLTNTFFNAHSLIVFVISIGVALIVGRIIAAGLRKLVLVIGKSADKSPNLRTVNKLRRYETILVLSIAVIRTALVIFGIYFWWQYVHPGNPATGIVGASAIFAVVMTWTLGPVLRDVTAGSFMMAEHWYGVGDHIRIEPFLDAQGVVERVTLRSTRLRGLNGEIIWINNQAIQGVRLAPKGIISIGLEIIVNDLEAGRTLIERANRRLPRGPLLMVNPLTVVTEEQVADELWHITAIAETAPGREWLIEKSAVDIMTELDEAATKPALIYMPMARYADPEADKRFARTIKNARKRSMPRREVVTQFKKTRAAKAKASAKKS
jgi:hypothetical protein